MGTTTAARIVVKVQPNATRDEVVRFVDDVLYVKVAAPPVRGKANAELINLLSRELRVAKSSIRIEKGLTSRKKLIRVEGVSQAYVVDRLSK